MFRKKYVLMILAIIAVGVGAYALTGVFKKGDLPKSNVAKQEVKSMSATEQTGEIWSKRCDKEPETHCEIFQRLSIKESKQRLIELAIGYPKASANAQIVMIVPLGISVTEGVTIRVDEQGANKLPVKTCDQNGCYVLAELAAPFIESMKTGKGIVVGFLDARAKKMEVKLSLQGFPQALDSLK